VNEDRFRNYIANAKVIMRINNGHQRRSHAEVLVADLAQESFSSASKEAGLDIGRRVKARRIAAAIRSLGGGAHEARQFSNAEWTMADTLSRTKPCARCHGTGVTFGQWCRPCKGSGKIAPMPERPPSEVTRALVIEYLSRPDDAPRDCDVPPVNNRQ
jgi:hypothetical protein